MWKISILKKFVKIFKTETNKENDRFEKNGFDNRTTGFKVCDYIIFENSAGRSFKNSGGDDLHLLNKNVLVV